MTRRWSSTSRRCSVLVVATFVLRDQFFTLTRLWKPSPFLQTRSGEVQHCHFEQAKGHFETDWNGTVHWNWTSEDSKACPIVDRLSPLIKQSEQIVKLPITFLMVGDSLDRNTVEFICQRGQPEGFRTIPIHTTNKKKRSSAPSKRVINRSSNICSNGNVTFAAFKIFGMHHECPNGQFLQREEHRHFPTTAERIEKVLPLDILSRIPNVSKGSNNNMTYVVSVGSALWDLSQGCNNHAGVDQAYQEQYRDGMLAIHSVLSRLLPGAPLYWKTSPRITKTYSERNSKLGLGRTMDNLQTLNGIHRQTVAAEHLGTVVDWWAQFQKVPESVLSSLAIRPDGRHYKREPSLAFFNMWLNAVWDRDASLLRP